MNPTEIPFSAEVLRRGAVAFLRKPFRQESLFDAVRSALAQRGKPTERERPD
jgi:FixJ family two-component response regulator